MLYRRNFTSYSRPAGKEGCRRAWKQALRNAWMWAKQEVAEAAKSAKQKAADRLAMLKAELMRFDARPWGMREHRVANERSELVSQIDRMSLELA